MNQPTDFVDTVALFMRLGGQTIDTFNAGQACLYMGLQLEELIEKLEAIKHGCVTQDASDRFDVAIGPLRDLCDAFKRGMHRGNLMRANPEDILDADLDLAVVSIGAALSFCTDAAAAAREVMRANLAKFPGGVATRDEQGKIKKPADWTPPKLLPYLERV